MIPSLRRPVSLLLLLASFPCLGASAPANDAWRRQVQDVWVPRAREALHQFDELSKAQLGQTLERRPTVKLATSERDVNGQEGVALAPVLSRGMDLKDLYEQSVRVPVRAYTLALEQQLAGQNAARVAPWLRAGVAELMADLVIDRMALPMGARDWRADADVALRNRPDMPLPATIAAAPEIAKDGATLAAYMVVQLQERSGTHFFAALDAYLQAAAGATFDADAAFKQAFGFTQAEHAAYCDKQLAALRAQVRVHRAPPVKAGGAGTNAPVPGAAQGASASPSVAAPAVVATPAVLPSAAAREAYARYQRARAPKAFAVSMRGQWGWAQDDSDAMADALRQCGLRDAVNCRLYAVDNEVQPQPPVGEIVVQMSGHAHDAWASEVGAKWLDVVRQSSAQFNQLLKNDMGVSLDQDIRIYIATDHDDYAQVLHTDMKMLTEAANDHAEVSGGLSNSRGQIAVLIRESLDERARNERAVKVPLHELTHALQKQLAAGYAGFPAPQWMREGSADLIAYHLARNVNAPGASDISEAIWADRCIAWYKKRGRKLDADEVFAARGPQWLAMMKEKRGPYQMAGLMMIRLKQLAGERFFRGLVEYFQRAGQVGQVERSVFAESFGIEPDAFLADFKEWAARSPSIESVPRAQPSDSAAPARANEGASSAAGQGAAPI
ncbi:MAG: hypothetical protein V4582_20965 [Pseudomonadota bacterium]